MRASPTILISVLLSTQALCAADKFTDDCMAPDYKHQVILRGEDGSGEYELVIRAPNDPKPLFSRQAGGYAAFGMATQPVNFKCLWSPDSKFVAIFERGTKRSGDTTIYAVTGDKVQEIPFPDLMPRIGPRLTAELRSIWVRPEVWLPDRELILSVEGNQMDEEHANFRFIITLQLRPTKTGKFAAKVASFRQDRSIEFSIKWGADAPFWVWL
jgi:hypothetical protein